MVIFVCKRLVTVILFLSVLSGLVFPGASTSGEEISLQANVPKGQSRASDQEIRGRLLMDLAQAEVDREAAFGDFDQAIEIAYLVDEKRLGLDLLIRGVEIGGRIKSPRVSDLAIRAIQMIESDDRGSDRDLVLRKLSVCVAEGNPSLAETLIQDIGRPEIRSWAYQALGERASPANPERAGGFFGKSFQDALSISDPLGRFNRMIGLAWSWSQVDHEAGVRTATQAAHSATRINDRAAVRQAMIRLGRVWGRIEPEKAFFLSSVWPEREADTRCEIFLAAAGSAEDLKQKRSFLELAALEIEQIFPGPRRDRAVVRLAEGLLALDPKEAFKKIKDLPARNWVQVSNFWDRATREMTADQWTVSPLAAPDQIDPATRIGYLAAVAEHISDRRREEGKAAALASEKLAMAWPSDRSWGAVARGWAGYSPKKALSVAGRIGSPRERSTVLAQLADIFQAAGDYDLARQARIDAKASAMGITDRWRRIDALVDLAKTWKFIHPDEARELLEMARQNLTG